MELKALEIFTAVAREGSVSKAATRLNRVQSNVSTRLKILEEELGEALFVRGKRPMTLTPNGELFLDYADKILTLSRDAVEAVKGEEPVGKFRVGAMESTAIARLPDVFRAYTDSHSKVDIDLVTGTAGALVDKLQNNEVEAIFIAEPFDLEGYETKPVFAEELLLVSPDPIEPTLNGRTMVAFEEGCAYRGHLDRWLKSSKIKPSNVVSLNSYLGILSTLIANSGFAVIPRSVLEMIAVNQNLHRASLYPGNEMVTTVLVWRKGYQSARLTALLNLFE